MTVSVLALDRRRTIPRTCSSTSCQISCITSAQARTLLMILSTLVMRRGQRFKLTRSLGSAFECALTFLAVRGVRECLRDCGGSLHFISGARVVLLRVAAIFQ